MTSFCLTEKNHLALLFAHFARLKEPEWISVTCWVCYHIDVSAGIPSWELHWANCIDSGWFDDKLFTYNSILSLSVPSSWKGNDVRVCVCECVCVCLWDWRGSWTKKFAVATNPLPYVELSTMPTTRILTPGGSTSVSGPEISGPHNDYTIWSFSGPEILGPHNHVGKIIRSLSGPETPVGSESGDGFLLPTDHLSWGGLTENYVLRHAFCLIIDACIPNVFASRISSRWSSVAGACVTLGVMLNFDTTQLFLQNA